MGERESCVVLHCFKDCFLGRDDMNLLITCFSGLSATKNGEVGDLTFLCYLCSLNTLNVDDWLVVG